MISRLPIGSSFLKPALASASLMTTTGVDDLVSRSVKTRPFFTGIL
jgi:hypothetical protein